MCWNVENSETDLRPIQIFKMELFVKITDGFKSLAIFAKIFILYVRRWFGYAFLVISFIPVVLNFDFLC